MKKIIMTVIITSFIVFLCTSDLLGYEGNGTVIDDYGTESPETGVLSDDEAVINNIVNTSTSLIGYQGYEDVSVTDWFFPEVRELTERKIMLGNNGYFYPQQNLTTAEATAVIAKMYGENVIYGGPYAFYDVPSTHWAYKYISWAKQKGIVNGITSTTFEPNASITRQDFAVIIMRYFQNAESFTPPSKMGKITYNDDSSISGYAKDSVYSLQRAGVFSAGSNVNFRPQSYITRAEVARVVFVAISLLIEDSQTVRDDQEATVLKFHAIFLTGKIYSTLTQVYRRADSWISLYDTSCLALCPKSFSTLYGIVLGPCNPFYVQFGQNSNFDREQTCIPGYFYNTSLWIGSARAATNTFKGYGSEFCQVKVSTLLYLEGGGIDGTGGISGTSHTLVLR